VPVTAAAGTPSSSQRSVSRTYIFWANYGSGGSGTTISRAYLNGTHVRKGFITGADGPLGVAVHDGYIYWSNPGRFGVCQGSAIGRATVVGTQVKQRFISGTVCPQNIAVSGRFIYWASRDTGNSIGRAQLNGSHVGNNFITDVSSPFGVAVAGGYIYWGDWGRA
jgi:hypothetical protein